MTLTLRTTARPLLLAVLLALCTACQTTSDDDGQQASIGHRHGHGGAGGEAHERTTPAADGEAERTQFAAPDKATHEQLAGTQDGEQRFRLLDELRQAYVRTGHSREAFRVDDEIVADSRISAGHRSLAASSLSIFYGLSNDFPRSQQMLDTAMRLAQDTGAGELETLTANPTYQYLYAEAEMTDRFWGHPEVALRLRREATERAWHDYNDPSLSANRHRAAVNVLLGELIQLTRSLVENKRADEAMNYANEIRWDLDNGPQLRPTPLQRAQVEVARAIALSSFDDYDAALDAINSAISGLQQMNAPADSHDYARALGIRLMIALALGRIGQHRDDANLYEQVAAADPKQGGEVGAAERASLILAARGDWDGAHQKIADALYPRHHKHGSGRVAGMAGERVLVALQLMYEFEDPHGTVSESQITRYVTPFLDTGDDWDDTGERGIIIEDGVLAASMARLMRGGAESQELAFRIAELFHVKATQGAMIDGATRLSATTPGLLALIEQEQTLRYQQAADPSTVASTDAQLRSLHRQIVKQFPLYRQLVAPAVPTAGSIGAVLHPGEIYVDLYAGRDASYAFVVHPGGAFRAVALDANRAALRKQVEALRAGFDAGLPPTQPGELAGFDLTAAASLYSTLIAPIEADLQGATTVYISTSGVLASIPYEVLITRPGVSLAQANWWIDTVTPVRMPSGSALVLARGQHVAHASQPLIAFADPSFDGSNAAPTERVRGLAGARAFPVDSSAATFDYHRVVPLPETLDEARAIAAALDAPETSVLSGLSASRSRALKENMSDDRVVLFATHGVIPGEVPGVHKAGLALAYEGSGLPDSILTADDIVTLRLNADWVILSACNTGLATGDAGDSVSALSRAFFAAGARSMLVTQWAVESNSAAQITGGLFRVYAADPALSKAAALARVERDMKGGKYGPLYQHPYFWAAYFLAGDAAR
ncbi:CHAT domain-containing protein [Paraburkholderia sp. 1N]|uniref:CHAT domain-containing protein n=1 Tax=Paraburkholderia solitsugae TaxID=2675748 RepID=A0ABX2BZZ3_9BURK|nr:CHAT domain-containing protein [Paraburkholderia solitsugae]NPT45616.1 CHAT domain-containing protein [Paraburkholderia solitsugae]